MNEDTVTEHQNVHFGPQEAVKCFRGFADDGFILVERGIENHWKARQLAKRFYQRKRSLVLFETDCIRPEPQRGLLLGTLTSYPA